MRFRKAWYAFTGTPFVVVRTADRTELQRVRTKPDGRQYIGSDHLPRFIDPLPKSWRIVEQYDL